MKKKCKNGFTLVELMASLAIFSILAATAMSLISLGFKHNSINGQRYQSDLNAKAFFEMLRPYSNRPGVVPPVGVGGIATPKKANGCYKFLFNDGDDVIARSKTEFLNLSISPDSALDPTGPSGLTTVMNNVKAANYPTSKYAIIVKTKYDTANNVYDIELWSWDMGKGQSSMINRKMLIRPNPTP